MSLPEPYAVTLAFTDALERLGLHYLIGCSLASSLHGVPRSTNDADVVAAAFPDGTGAVVWESFSPQPGGTLRGRVRASSKAGPNATFSARVCP